MRPLLVCAFAAMVFSSCDRAWWVDDQLTRSFAWSYDGAQYDMHLNFPREAYEFYDSLPKHGNGYETYVWESREHEYLAELAGQLYETGKCAQLTDREIAAFILAFVQSIGYVSHGSGVREYTKYPILTVVDGGNCLDLSILYASLCETLGIETILVTVPGHMFVGVACRGCEGYAFMFRQRRYYTAECTAEGWLVGDIDASVDTARTVTLIDVERPATFNRPRKVPSRGKVVTGLYN